MDYTIDQGNMGLKTPEVLLDKVDKIDLDLALKVDIYGLGMIYYYLMYGKYPYNYISF